MSFSPESRVFLQQLSENNERAWFCTGSDCLDTVLQLRLPFDWHKPDGLRGVT